MLHADGADEECRGLVEHSSQFLVKARTFHAQVCGQTLNRVARSIDVLLHQRGGLEKECGIFRRLHLFFFHQLILWFGIWLLCHGFF